MEFAPDVDATGFAALVPSAVRLAASTTMLGHGYFASEHPMLAELRLLVVESFPPVERQPPLKPIAGAFDYPLWAIAAP